MNLALSSRDRHVALPASSWVRSTRKFNRSLDARVTLILRPRLRASKATRPHTILTFGTAKFQCDPFWVFFLASLALFFFGFLFWDLNPLPYQSWIKPTDESGAMEALRNHFPERGTYFCPSFDADPKVTDEKFRKGPLAFFYAGAARSPDGRSPHHDPGVSS